MASKLFIILTQLGTSGGDCRYHLNAHCCTIPRNNAQDNDPAYSEDQNKVHEETKFRSRRHNFN